MGPPLATLPGTPELVWLGPGNGVPNNPELALIVIRQAVDPAASDAAIRALLDRNGWGGTWSWTVFDLHHFHPNAHEVLVVSRGWGELIFGGRGGLRLTLRAGDAAILPAGTAHCRVGGSADFTVCGGYPPGQLDFETLLEGEGGSEIAARVARVARPASDPLYGPGGLLSMAWKIKKERRHGTCCKR